MTDPLDELLQAPGLRVPQDFTDKVMARVEAVPGPEPHTQHQASAPWVSIQWLALLGGILAGAAQLLTFMFGIWFATSAG
jgi:hypothetical protein